MNYNVLINAIVMSILFSIYLASIMTFNKREMKKGNKDINFIQNIFLLKPLRYSILLIISNVLLLIIGIVSFTLSILTLINLFDFDILITLLNSITLLIGFLNLIFIVKKFNNL